MLDNNNFDPRLEEELKSTMDEEVDDKYISDISWEKVKNNIEKKPKKNPKTILKKASAAACLTILMTGSIFAMSSEARTWASNNLPFGSVVVYQIEETDDGYEAQKTEQEFNKVEINEEKVESAKVPEYDTFEEARENTSLDIKSPQKLPEDYSLEYIAGGDHNSSVERENVRMRYENTESDDAERLTLIISNYPRRADVDEDKVIDEVYINDKKVRIIEYPILDTGKVGKDEPKVEIGYQLVWQEDGQEFEFREYKSGLSKEELKNIVRSVE
ncbi:hypothetical protein [Natranaerofaba carboxydovora]|uniref:hypothetical protein n=1 Tax=Natranaerofaba carboxydovora TaxID=2742683 RepID=UPI001F147B4F|nr:hypothetical protein [Natranaerofaba carboxydovora]UMZ74439.1 hypothetical protein ACONDI_02031 [Natranaerofaba carboxydovora]